MRADVKAPSDVRFASQQSASSLTVEWTRPGCGETGYIEHFIVTACPHDDVDCDCQRGHGKFALYSRLLLLSPSA